MSEVVIEARDVVKSYGDRNVVDQVSLQVAAGECFGILGPNGAGKSSFMRLMYCSSPLSSGELFLLGLNVKSHQRKIKSRTGVVSQEEGLDPDFNVYDNLSLYANYHNIAPSAAKEKIIELLHLVRLEDQLNAEIDKLTLGQRRKLSIARALINDPQILFLDEPTAGLDPSTRAWIRDLLVRIRQEGKTLVITTRYFEEAELMCDRVALMHEGRLMTHGAPQTLIHERVGREVVEFAISQTDVQYFIRRMNDQYNFQVLNNRIQLFIRDSQDYRKAMEMVESHNIVIRKATLGDVFLKVTGLELRE